MQYTPDQVMKLAPDDASAKAGQQLASNANWVVKYKHEKAIWGDCQGSGKTPYKTIIDIGNIAFKCSCPSRKFPCKHGIGLLLLFVANPDVFSSEKDLAPHVREWLDKREEKETAKVEKEGKPADETAKAKRAESRERKVNGGIDELRSWLKDVVRAGIMNVPQEAHRFALTITARMVDAQAGGLANQLRQINKINFYQDGWQRMLVKRLSAIYLITEGYKNCEQLPAEWQKELQTLIGWTTPKEEVLQSHTISDIWSVLSVTNTDEGNIITERIWLYGLGTQRFALLLNFYAGNAVSQQLFVPGMRLKADVVFFPGVMQYRALIKTHDVLTHGDAVINATTDAQALQDQITSQLAQNPFVEQIPFLLADVQIVLNGDRWAFRDFGGKGNALGNPHDECWQMLAFTKSNACNCFGVYEREQFEIHTLWVNNKMCFVK